MAPLYLGARDISGPGAGKRAPMNCLLEAAASLWLGARRRVMTEPPEEEVVTAQEGLEQCRRNMEARERELLGLVDRLTEEALAKRRAGDALAARSKILERRRVQKRLERLRHGLDLVDTQLDAIKTSELDKEIMLTLKASTNAMRKAGITLGVQEVENVMSEMDEQMREVQDITEVLSNPLNALGPEEADLDAELDLLDALAEPPVRQQEDPAPALLVPVVLPSPAERGPVVVAAET
jgi:hypothetical protein